MRKVFRDFWKNSIVKNNKIVIPIGIAVIITIIGIITITNQESNTMEVEDLLNRELESQEITPEIEAKLKEIEKNIENSKNIETKYDPKRARDWITSGPFQIDRNEYALGENIFIRAVELEVTEKGQIAFLRQSNATHYSVYITIPFDGAKQPSFGQYFTPDLSKIKGVCSIDDIAGEWTTVFRGTNYENIKFTVSDKIFVIGQESRFDPVC